MRKRQRIKKSLSIIELYEAAMSEPIFSNWGRFDLTTLARKAIQDMQNRQREDISEWARKLAEDAAKFDD